MPRRWPFLRMPQSLTSAHPLTISDSNDLFSCLLRNYGDDVAYSHMVERVASA